MIRGLKDDQLVVDAALAKAVAEDFPMIRGLKVFNTPFARIQRLLQKISR